MYKLTIVYADGVQTEHIGKDWNWLLFKHIEPFRAIEKIHIMKLLVPDRDQLPLFK